MGLQRNPAQRICQVTTETQGGGDGLIKTFYEYTLSGQLFALVDDQGNRTEWDYDAHGRKILETKGLTEAPELADQITSPTSIGWTFNANGTLQSMEREDGTDLGYSYDAARRLTAIEATNLAAGLVGTTDQSFAYDGLGRRTRALDENTPSTTGDDVVTTWYYDTLGRQVEETLKFGSVDTRVVSRSYNADGLSAVVYPSDRWLDYTRFVDGATHAIYNDGESGTPIAEYEYIGGRTLRRAMKNGIDLDFRDGSGTHYDGLGRPLRWAHVEGSTVKIGFEYNHDQAGNRLQQRNLHDPLDSQRYAYDSSSRLVAASRGDYPVGDVATSPTLYCDPATTPTWTTLNSSFQWILDGAGNWDHYNTINDSTPTNQTRTDTNFNEIHQVGAVTLEHNDNGDMTFDGAKRFVLDAFGRLREVRSSTGTLIATYFYDAGHRRVRKDLVSGTDLDFLFDGWRAVEYRNSSTQAVLAELVFGNYLDEILEATLIDGETSTPQYYHQNALYSVYGISNPSGVLFVAYEYDPYGAHVLLTDGDDGDSAVNFNSNDIRTADGSIGIVNLTFTGQTFDPESGLLYYKNRYYHPTLGRFVGRDPKGYVDGPNLQAYVRCNPLGNVDPMGTVCLFKPWRIRSIEFVGCTPSQLDDFRMIPEDYTSQGIYAPSSGWNGPVDGFWYKWQSPNAWFKIMNHCHATITCNSNGFSAAACCNACINAALIAAGQPIYFGWVPDEGATRHGTDYPWDEWW